MDHQNSLELWRKDIRQIDDEIMRLAARRMDLAVKIGSYKRDHDLPVKDFRVERQIVEKARLEAPNMGLDPNFAEELMTTLIRYSVDKQGEIHRDHLRATEPAAQNALVIGGLGKMGQWFAQYYQSLGYTIWIHDQKKAPSSYSWHDDIRSNLDRYEIIIVATPLNATNDILLGLAEQKPKGIIIETSSLKNPIKSGLDALRKQQIRVACLHPMFGPDTDILIGRNILFCTGDGLISEQIVHAHFKMTSARLVPIAITEHDQQMQYTLALSHFINFLHALLIKKSGHSLQRLRETGGPTFVSQLKVTETIISENAGLSFDIQKFSCFTGTLFQEMESTLQNMGALLKADKKDEFLDKIAEARAFFQNQT